MKEHVAMCLWRGVGGGALLSPKMHKPKKDLQFLDPPHENNIKK